MSLMLPNMPVPFIDQRTGQISVPWYQALLKISSTVTGALVSSVNISGNNGITVAGSPITTVGVITLGIGNLTCASAQIAGTVTSANERTGTLIATGTITAAAVQAVNIAATGTITSASIINSGTISSASVIATATISSVELISTGTLTANDVVILGALTFMKPLTNSLGSPVSLTTAGSYYDGPSISVGAVGTFYASGTVTLTDSAGAAAMNVRLTDGVSVMASCRILVGGAGQNVSGAISGMITNPAGNIRIQVNDSSSGNGTIIANLTGNAKDSTITAYRIA